MACICSLDAPEMAPLWSLQPTEQDMADERYSGATDRARFLERRALLRALVAGQTDAPASDIVIGYDEAGAPVLRHPPSNLRISSAGRGELAAAAMALSPVGVDLEPLTDVEPVDAVLHPRERERLEQSDKAVRALAFLRIWTMKEAYLKALRTGLRRDPVLVEIQALDETSARIVDDEVAVACIADWNRATISGREIVAACVVLEG